MTITYPLTFPAVSIVKSAFRIVRTSSQSESPITKSQQTYKFPGECWEGEVTFRPTTMLNAGKIKSFLGELYGVFGTFLYGDPDYLAKGPQGALGGVPVVDGASQGPRVNVLNIKGLTPTITNVYRKGDYFSLGAGLNMRLYMITQDFSSDGAGKGTLQFVPALRVAPGDGDALTITGAKGLMRSSENVAQWDSDFASIHGFVFAFKEAVGE